MGRPSTLRHNGAPLDELPTLERYHLMWQARELALWLTRPRWETLTPADRRTQPHNPRSDGRIIRGELEPDQRRPSAGVDQPGEIQLWGYPPIRPEPRIHFQGATLRLEFEVYEEAERVMENEGLLLGWEDYLSASRQLVLFRVSGQRGGGYSVKVNAPASKCQAALVALGATSDITGVSFPCDAVARAA
jgi:hypothetical protein